jgi:hypothetical protein
MTGKRLMIGSAAIAVAALVSVSGASAFDGHRGGGGGHVRGEGARMGSGFSGVHVASPGQGASSVATGRTMAGQGYAGRYASGYARGYGATTGRYAGGYSRYGYGHYGYGALGAGIGLGPAGWGWGYPGYAYSSGYDWDYPGYAYASGYGWGYPGYASDSGYGWGYPGYASTWGAGNCTCGGHFTSGTAGAW